MIRVVCINAKQDNFTHYIGRAWAGLPESIYHNPFHVGKDGDRKEVLIKFILYWYSLEQAELRSHAAQLPEDAVLGCWCKPLECHGDVIKAYWELKRPRLF